MFHQTQKENLLSVGYARDLLRKFQLMLGSNGTSMPNLSEEHYGYHLNYNSTDAYPADGIRLVFTLIYGLLSFAGIVGNFLVVLVVLRVKNMLSPTNCYLVSLAISDSLFFVAAAPVELAYLHLPAMVYPFDMIGCRIMTYLPFLAINASSLSITAFTIERYIGICHPMRARYLCTVRRARIIIVSIWIFTILYNSPWLFLATLKPVRFLDIEESTCTFKISRSNWSYRVIFVGDFFAFYLIPMLLYLILYGRIAFTLTTASVQKETKRYSKREASPRPTRSVMSNGENCVRTELVIENEQTTSQSSTKRTQDQERNTFVSGARIAKGRSQVVKMLAVIVSVFAICWLPYRAMVVYNSFASKPWSPKWFIFFAKTMIFINCAINPIFYNLMSVRFRCAFASLFRINRCRKPTAGEASSLLKPSRTWRTFEGKQPDSIHSSGTVIANAHIHQDRAQTVL